MNSLISNFNKSYPALSSTIFSDSCTIEEPDNLGKDALQRLIITGFNGYGFPHEFVSQLSSFACKAQSGPLRPKNECEILRLNCDKVILFERDGQKFMLFCELKSTFSPDEIAHAKDQIVGSLVKVRSLLYTLQDVSIDEYKPIGLIASFQPTVEQMIAASKKYDQKSSFAVTLNSRRKYLMPAVKTDKFYYPLKVGAIELYYLPVPGRIMSYSVDISSIIL